MNKPTDVSNAAAILGRAGGSVHSAAQVRAARRNLAKARRSSNTEAKRAAAVLNIAKGRAALAAIRAQKKTADQIS